MKSLITVSLLLAFALILQTPVHALIWNFDSEKELDDWEIVNGEWEVKDGNLVGQIGTDYMGIAGGDVEWTDYTVEMKASVGTGQYTYFMVRVQDDPLSYYTFERTQTGNMNAFRRDAGAHSKLAAGGALPGGHEEFHIWKFVVEGDTMTAYLDDEELLVIEDPNYETGRIGIGGYNSDIVVDYISIEGPGIPANPVESAGKLASSWGSIKAN